jgi:hypothetical protein
MRKMAKFLVKNEAVVGRTKADGGSLPAVDLVFYNVVEAASREKVDELLIQYKDPGFVTRVVDVTEIPSEHADKSLDLVLAALHGTSIKEQRD